MPRAGSSTGLIAARIRPVARPKNKHIELSGSSKPAPFVLRPFSGLFNPYPYGCSVLCNHPADGEARDVVRRAKDCWASEGRALLLPAEMELIRASLLAGGRTTVADGVVDAAPSVPEELFRRYTETDSRPLTPAPTLASGPPARLTSSPETTTVNPRERTTLVLDLRANSQQQEQDTETLSWHALSLEPAPSPRNRSELYVPKPKLTITPTTNARPSSISPPPPSVADISNVSSPKNVPVDSACESDEPIMKRRGKRLRKRKCRRGSTYGQQTEVRDPPEPLETQVSQVGVTSRDTSARPSLVDGRFVSPPSEVTTATLHRVFPKSFIDPEILKHLGRELNRGIVEAEFSVKRRIALEEALRVNGEKTRDRDRGEEFEARSSTVNVPRVFSRQSARFEIPMDSQTLGEMTSLQYLSRHVYVTSGRKLIFGRAFSRHANENENGSRFLSPKDVFVALEEVMGRSLSDEQLFKLKNTVGDVETILDFRMWCGFCAAVERLVAPLPPRELDPPTWIERADLEGLDRKLRNVRVDDSLSLLLTEIRDR